MPTLKELLFQYNTDKDKYHPYGDLYQELFTPIRQSVTSVLEIGVMAGESLRVWRDFFPKAFVLGVDIDINCLFTENRIGCKLGDQADPHSLADVASLGPFDIIIDDGSHKLWHQLLSLLYLWSSLKVGGYYCIEDILYPNDGEIFKLVGATVYDYSIHPESRLAIIQKVA